MSKKQKRRVTFQLYPNGAELKALEAMLELHRLLYNWALGLLIEADKQGGLLKYYDITKLFTVYKREHTEFQQLNAQSAQQTILRACIAFDRYLERKRNGKKPGYQRFKQPGR